MIDAHCAVAILRGAVAAGCPKCDAFGADVLAGRPPAVAGTEPERAPEPARQAAPPDQRRFDDLPDMCTPEQARKFLQIGKTTIFELLKVGALPGVKFGRLIRIPKAALLEAGKAERPARSSAAGRREKPKPRT